MKKLSLCLAATVGLWCNAQVPASLDSVFAPVKVAVQPSDSYIGLSVMPDGEIRHYNYGEQAEPGVFYISSRDKGLTWKNVKYAKDMPEADTRSPKSGEYLRLVNMGGKGVYCIRTNGGTEGDRTVTKVSDIGSIMLKPPVFVDGGNRVVVAAHGGVSPKGCYTYVSDDDGLTWQRSNTVITPEHRGGGHHNGIRWNHGAVEPTVVELRDGRLWMLMRTPQDVHYQAFSKDGGKTWSKPEPSRFYGTITMPTIGRLSDGRLIFFWCNTTPLPELASANGVWDDVFTNRDVTHVAISEDDGKTWRGFRELRLNPRRNDSNYATYGRGIDRGMHQAQFVEVDSGKILAAIGQHRNHRAVVMFDVDWLYETSRYTDFSDSLSSWSTFNYIKGIKGHCSYNRINGVTLTAHPDKPGRQVMNVRYEPADTLVSDLRGAVWNFPAMKRGSITSSVKIPKGSRGVKMVLNDRWFNPSDSVATYECMYALDLSRSALGIKDDKWHSVEIKWDVERGGNTAAVVKVDGSKKKRVKLPLRHATTDGISYVHFIAFPDEEYESNPGITVESVYARERD